MRCGSTLRSACSRMLRPGDLSLRRSSGSGPALAYPAPIWVPSLFGPPAHDPTTLGTRAPRYRAKNVQLSAHYTLSYNKSDDDNERQPNEISYQNPFDFRPDYK
ncbi:MAG: hypothetical protein JWN34_596 [Bryobacterales bacterium]|nr:hypothetical protein [Bryobacterales bacterium]